MIKDKVLSSLSELGFIPEEIEGFGYSVDYEGLTIVYSEEEEDTKCLTMIVPNLFDVTEENRVAVLEALVKISRQVKYAQPHIMFDNQVWINYQHYLGDNEVTSDLIEHMIRVLAYASAKFNMIINGDENDD